VWRDIALVVVLPITALIEGFARTDLEAPVLSVVAAIALVPTLLWRRTHPLLMFVIGYVVSAVVTVAIGQPSTLYTSAFLLLLPYALIRWGSGRSIIIGAALILANIVVTAVRNPPLISVESVGALVVVSLIAAVAGIFRVRASARMRELDAARSLEREQFARDLHDTVAHHLSAIAIRAQAGLATAPSHPRAAVEALEVIESEATRTLDEMRGMVRALRRDDPAERAPGFGVADLEALAHSGDGGPTVRVRISGEVDDLPPALGTAVYRIAQESVTNARRHARHATAIDVEVEADEREVRLNVRDDGDGAAAARPGYGITGMIERATLLGGTCAADRAPDGGWIVTARLPRPA
jgi:signal transduction histidine kinase